MQSVEDLLQKVLTAKRESKQIEFKETFDSNSGGEWCEVIKDFVAIANSGGGVIAFGLTSNGAPSGKSITSIENIDPAEFTDKISKYTGISTFEFEIHVVKKEEQGAVAIIIYPVSVPLVFERPGTYDTGGGKQKNAFSSGTVYFRHGAKSEPGTSEDIRKVIERQLEQIRRSWLKNVRKVIKSPPGSQFISVEPQKPHESSRLGTRIRVVGDPSATPLRLTRDRSEASGSFIHEEISDGIFDEINNVIGANVLLSKGQNKFLFGQPIYYRIYAERKHVKGTLESNSLLFHSGFTEFYAPFMYWLSLLPEETIAKSLRELIIYPKHPQVQSLLRIALLLGPVFIDWLNKKWQARWKKVPQPPAFYWTFQEMISHPQRIDSRLVAARFSLVGQISFDKESILVKDLLEKPSEASRILSMACMKVFEGDNGLRGLCRSLDYLAYGDEVQKRVEGLTTAVIQIIGDQKVEV